MRQFKKDRTCQSAYQFFNSLQSRCWCRCRWVFSIFLMKIKLPSLIFTAMEMLGREKQLYQGGKQQSKERRGPLSIHSSATCKPNMSSGIKDHKLVMLTPIKTPAPQVCQERKPENQGENPLARPKNHPNFCHNKSTIKPGSQLGKLSTLTSYIIVFTSLHTYPFSTWPIQISNQNTVCPQNFRFTFSKKSTTTTTNKLHWAK